MIFTQIIEYLNPFQILILGFWLESFANLVKKCCIDWLLHLSVQTFFRSVNNQHHYLHVAKFSHLIQTVNQKTSR